MNIIKKIIIIKGSLQIKYHHRANWGDEGWKITIEITEATYKRVNTLDAIISLTRRRRRRTLGEKFVSSKKLEGWRLINKNWNHWSYLIKDVILLMTLHPLTLVTLKIKQNSYINSNMELESSRRNLRWQFEGHKDEVLKGFGQQCFNFQWVLSKVVSLIDFILGNKIRCWKRTHAKIILLRGQQSKHPLSSGGSPQ